MTNIIDPCSDDEPAGKARGGKARAAKMTAEERKASSKKAAQAKKEKAKLPVAINEGKLKIGDLSLDVAVLPDGRRVILQAAVFKAFGRPQRGERQPVGVEIKLPPFMDAKNLVPYINQDVMEKIKPIYFRSKGGLIRSGYEASILPAICNVYLRANDDGALRSSQANTVKKADILVRGLAEVGVIALIDEATGYQRDREKNALAKILEDFVAKELRPWVTTFPADYYEGMFKIYGLEYPPAGNKSWRPSFIGTVTNNVVYSRLAPELLPELKKAATKAQKKAKLHQWLSEDIGHPRLREHLASIVTLLKISKTPEQFYELVDTVHPKFEVKDDTND